ncbi:MAG: AraC family transcriptional regulator [Colwellia sp.]
MIGYQRHDQVLDAQQLLLSLIDLAKQRGAHPDKLLKGTKLFYDNLSKNTFTCSANTLLTVIENCCKLVNNNEISFLLGRRYFPSHLGALGQALMNCRHLADMLRICQCYQLSSFPLMNMQIKHFNANSYLIFDSAVGQLSNNQQIFISEFLLSTMLGTMKFRCKNIPDLVFHLPFAKVQHIEQYHTQLGMKLLFDQKIFMVSIASELLYIPFDDSSQHLKTMAMQQVKHIYSKQDRNSFVQQVNSYLRHGLINHKELSQECCAAHFGYSSATLKRKLASHHLNYQGIIDNIRSQEAIFQLIVCQHSNEKVAEALYFTDVSNFRKAFKRWTGMTPNSMRTQLNY